MAQRAKPRTTKQRAHPRDAQIPQEQLDPKKSARAAGLRYVTDEQPGIGRVKHGSGFAFERMNGKKVRDKKVLARIKSLVIPPAWTDVWICPLENGHLQATGLDARR